VLLTLSLVLHWRAASFLILLLKEAINCFLYEDVIVAGGDALLPLLEVYISCEVLAECGGWNIRVQCYVVSTLRWRFIVLHSVGGWKVGSPVRLDVALQVAVLVEIDMRVEMNNANAFGLVGSPWLSNSNSCCFLQYYRMKLASWKMFIFKGCVSVAR
jgi:hypothetical protein